MNKSRTVYECCRGLHYTDPSLPENPREISYNKVFKARKLITLRKNYMNLLWNETETDKLSDSPRIFVVDFVRAVTSSRPVFVTMCGFSATNPILDKIRQHLIVLWTKLSYFYLQITCMLKPTRLYRTKYAELRS